MSPHQKEVYHKKLVAYRKTIWTEAGEILKSYLFRGMLCRSDIGSDENALIERTYVLLDAGVKAGALKQLYRTLFQSYSVDEMLKAATPWKNKLMYEAYAPYWLAHCRWSEEKRMYFNDIYGMYWDSDNGIWEDENGASWRFDMPPTAELIALRYGNVRKRRE